MESRCSLRVGLQSFGIIYVSLLKCIELRAAELSATYQLLEIIHEIRLYMKFEFDDTKWVMSVVINPLGLLFNHLIDLVHHSQSHMTNWPSDPWDKRRCILVKLIMQISGIGTRCKISLRWIPQKLINEKSKLVLSISKPSPEPLLTQIYVAAWLYKAIINQPMT